VGKNLSNRKRKNAMKKNKKRGGVKEKSDGSSGMTAKGDHDRTRRRTLEKGKKKGLLGKVRAWGTLSPN